MKSKNITLIFCALLTVLFSTPLKAQENKVDGPSIEETVEYINKIVSVSLGGSKPDGKDSIYYLEIVDQKFSIDKIIYEEEYVEKRFGASSIGKQHGLFSRTYENISWGELESIKEGKYGSLIEITIYFNLPLYFSWKNYWKEDNRPYGSSKSQNFLEIYVLPERVESVKKALLHLKKLMYKEDFFGN